MKRVRKTAKWSQLYQTGPSIPAKNKASFLNNPDDEEEDEQPDIRNDQMLSSGTYRHMQNEFEEIHDVQANNGEAQRSGQNVIPDIQVGLSGGQSSEGKSNIQVFQKMRKEMSETPDQSNGD